jgi:hypothetical protein
MGVALVCGLGWFLLGLGRGTGPDGAGAARPAVPAAPEGPVFRMAYGTEKKMWLEAAVEEFRQKPEAQGITIDLVGKGSVEGAEAAIKAQPEIHVWSPASSAVRDLYEHEWHRRLLAQRPLILRSKNLALTPMVFVFWKSRYEAFIKTYSKVSFKTIGQAMREPGGWGTIGGKSEWGRFKFTHTDANKSNSGVQTLVLMAYEFAKKDSGLTKEDVTRPEFQSWLRDFEATVVRSPEGLIHSTGTLMEDMVLKGPSQYDALMMYENLAIEHLDNARDRWEELRVVYPEPDVLNEHPYYILDVPWSKDLQRKTAERLLTYLMSSNVQRRALDHGFRPGDPSIPVRFPESPLVRHEAQGLRIEIPRLVEPLKGDVFLELLASYQRIEPKTEAQ